MNVFGHSYEVFIPDSNVIFPCILLRNVPRLNRETALLKECFDLLRDKCNYLFLPSNEVDFKQLLMDKYRQFLGDIVREIRKAKQGNFSQDEFYRRTRSQLRAMDYGELIQLWEHEKEKFWECVSLDPNIVTMRMRRNAIDKINLFSRLTERKLIQFSDEEQKTSEAVMTLLSELQNAKELTSTANAADLAILADCLVYKSTRLAQGVMYLVTGDNELIKATDEVVNNPHLINPDYDPEHVMPGLKPLRPRDFLVGIKRVI